MMSLTISRIELSRPPGVSRRMIASGAWSSRASSSALPSQRWVAGSIVPLSWIDGTAGSAAAAGSAMTSPTAMVGIRTWSARSITERELRLLAHHVGGPRRREDHLGIHPRDAVELADELLDLLADLRTDRTARRREGEGDIHLTLLDRDLVDQAQLDEVEPELGIDHVRQRVLDVLDRWHGL